MSKFYYIIILAVCLAACGETPHEVELKGQLKGLTNDTVFIYGNDELSNLVDTMYVVNGRIAHTIPVDTLMHVMLILNNNREYPLYLDKGRTISIHGDLAVNELLDVKGGAENEQLTAFNQSLQSFSANPVDTANVNRADAFIRTHPTSPVSIYLLDKYFVQKANPDLAKIRELITSMDGTLQDKPYVANLSKQLEQAEKAQPGKVAISFSLPNANGETINRARFRNTYLLINFWASWCDSCQIANTQLKQIHKKYKKNEKFSMLGISLDMDKNNWKEAIKADTLSWEQVCDFTGWDNNTAQQYGVYRVPYNLLLGTDGKVLERDIKGDALTNKLEELLKEEKKKR